MQQEEGQHIAQQRPQQDQEPQPEEPWAEEELPRSVDNPNLDQVQPFVKDLYFATARPRFDPDPICLRRQRQNASIAAGIKTKYKNSGDFMAPSGCGGNLDGNGAVRDDV